MTKVGINVKYSLSPRENNRTPPSRIPLSSPYISLYIPPLVLIQIESELSILFTKFRVIHDRYLTVFFPAGRSFECLIKFDSLIVIYLRIHKSIAIFHKSKSVLPKQKTKNSYIWCLDTKSVWQVYIKLTFKNTIFFIQKLN